MNQIKDIKIKYGQQAERIISSGLNLRQKGRKYHCPNTQAHKNGDSNPSMSWDPDALQFYCFTCSMKIDLYGYYRDHLNYTHQEIIGELLGTEDYKETIIEKSRNNFKKEIEKIGVLDSKCLNYINTRGIDEETTKIFNLGTYKGSIAFPYYKYREVVGCKLRRPEKHVKGPKMWNIEGSKPFLFGFQNIDIEKKEIIICEGEFDALVLYQCGFKNTVSVGAGGRSLKSLIEQAKDFFNQFQSIIVISDNDKTGTEMDRYFSQVFGNKAKLIDKKLYTRIDVNEEYVVNGREKIIDLVESARFRIEGRRNLERNPYRGIKARMGNYIPTGLNSIDYAINDLAPGRTTLITGRSNDGKSTLVKQIISNAIDKGNTVYLMSGEGDQEVFIGELYQCVIGRDEKYYNLTKVNKRYFKEPKERYLQKLQKWHYKKLALFNKGDSKLKTMDELFLMLEEEIKFHNHDLVVIDNLMSILSVEASEKYEAQADFMQRLSDLADNYNTHIILVLHPNKTYRKGQSMDFEQISGSSDLYNKADNILGVIREFDEDKKAQGINGRIKVLKNRYYPELTEIEIYFDEETKLLLERLEDGSILSYNFRWKDEEDVNMDGLMPVIAPDCPF